MAVIFDELFFSLLMMEKFQGVENDTLLHDNAVK